MKKKIKFKNYKNSGVMFAGRGKQVKNANMTVWANPYSTDSEKLIKILSDKWLEVKWIKFGELKENIEGYIVNYV